jgi:hypothetical protein
MAPANVPTLDVDHQEHGDALALWQRELRTIDRGLIVQAVAGFLRRGHSRIMAAERVWFKRGD